MCRACLVSGRSRQREMWQLGRAVAVGSKSQWPHRGMKALCLHSPGKKSRSPPSAGLSSPSSASVPRATIQYGMDPHITESAFRAAITALSANTRNLGGWCARAIAHESGVVMPSHFDWRETATGVDKSRDSFEIGAEINCGFSCNVASQSITVE